VISVPPQTSNFDLDLDTSNPPNTFVNKMSVRKAKSTKPRKTAAKKAGKKAVYVCSIPGCLKSYSGASGLHNHRQSVHRGRKHYCDVSGCLKSYSSSSRLHRHQQSVHQGRKYDCDVPGCLKSYNSSWMVRPRHFRGNNVEQQLLTLILTACRGHSGVKRSPFRASRAIIGVRLP